MYWLQMQFDDFDDPLHMRKRITVLYLTVCVFVSACSCSTCVSVHLKAADKVYIDGI